MTTENSPKTITMKSVDDLAVERGTNPSVFAAAKAVYRWPIGKQMTADAYDEAIKKINALRFR